MKTKKIIASVMSAALSITTIIPFEIQNADAFQISGDLSTYSVSADDYTTGDVNGDNKIDASDASCILSEYSILSTGGNATFNENQKKAADIDNNNAIDSSDASLILSYYSYTSTGGKLDIKSYLAEFITPPPATTTTATKSTTTATTAVSTKTSTNTSTVSGTVSTATNQTSATNSTSTSISTSTTTVTTTTAPEKVSSIQLDRSEIFIGLGDNELSANVKMFPESAKNKAEIWSSSDESVAIVDQEGYVYSKKLGDCKITVKSADNPEVSAEISVHIVDPANVKAIKLSRNEASFKVGEQGYAAIVTMYPKTADKSEKWTSSNSEIASVNDEGWLVAKKPGTCAITVQSVNNPSVFSVVLVTVYDNLPETTTATGSATTTSTATATNTDSNTATTTNTTTATTTTVEVSEIKLSKYEMTIPIGKKDISIVTMLPYDATDKGEKWVTSDEKIATIDKYGWVKGISIGECTITVYSVSNPYVKAEIKVKVVETGDAPDLDVNFSYIDGEKSDNNNIALCTPFPKNANGRFVIDYIITDSNGIVKTVSTSTLLIPEMKSVITLLTADTSAFTVDSYVTNLATNERAKIGTYKLRLNPRDTDSMEEDILSAFSAIGGLSQ